MGLPIVLLLLFLIRGLTLDGAGDGIKAYVGEWSMDVLTDRPDVWSTAVSQIFFSLSVTMGVSIHSDKRERENLCRTVPMTEK